MGVLATLISVALNIAAGFGMPARFWVQFATWVVLGVAVFRSKRFLIAHSGILTGLIQT